MDSYSGDECQIKSLCRYERLSFLSPSLTECTLTFLPAILSFTPIVGMNIESPQVPLFNNMFEGSNSFRLPPMSPCTKASRDEQEVVKCYT